MYYRNDAIHIHVQIGQNKFKKVDKKQVETSG